MLSFFKQRFKRHEKRTLRETILSLFEKSKGSKGDDSLDREELFLMWKILQLHQVTAEDVMIPRAEMKAVPADISLEDLARTVADTPYTRLPIYGQDLDDIKGFIHVKDLCRFWDTKETFSLKNITRKVLFISPSSPVLHLLMKMRTTQTPLAVVVDEQGGVDGLVTYRDIVREMIGEVGDVGFQEEAEPELTQNLDGSYEADGRLPIEALTQAFGLTLTKEEIDDEIDTLGGLISSLVNRVPDRLEVISHPHGLEFEVLDANPRRVVRVRILDKRVH